MTAATRRLTDVHRLLCVTALLVLGQPVARALPPSDEPCPIFVADPDPDDPVYGHCSLRGHWPMARESQF